jgi:predicted ATPase
MKICLCEALHATRRIVLTGGPGAGKTAVLELVRQQFCSHVQILPEAAGIVFGGGFPRVGSVARRKAAQRAIFFVQRELENLGEADNAAIVICDRGTVDGAAYWSGPDDFWGALGTTRESELKRYDAVIHLRTPPRERIQPRQSVGDRMRAAAAIDERLLEIQQHPRRFVVPASVDFSRQAALMQILRAEIPDCCKERQHESCWR